MRSSAAVGFLVIALHLTLPRLAAQAPRIEVRTRTADALHLRVLPAPEGSLRVESSPDLARWTEWKTVPVASGVAEFQFPLTADDPRRFIRAAIVAPAPGGTLAFVEPASGSIVLTNRPVIELRHSGIEVTPATFRLRLNGTNLPLTATFSEGRILCTPQTPLPDGFVELWAGVLDAKAVLAEVPRLNLNIRTGKANLPPLARDDVVSVESGRTADIPVLQNDRDPNDDTLAVAAIEPPLHGQANVVGNRVEYRPEPAFTGRDSFRYAVVDGRGGTNAGTVVVFVLPKPDLIARVADTPAAALANWPRATRTVAGEPLAVAFPTLGEAVAHLCATLPPGKRGKVVIEKGGVLDVGIVSFQCAIEIENRGGATLGGTNATFDAGGPLTLTGFGFASGGATFNVASDLNLIANTFAGPASVNLVTALPSSPGVALHSPHSGTAAHHVSIAGNRNTTLTVAGNADGDSTIDIERGQAIAVNATGKWSGSTKAKFEGMVTDTLSIRATLEGTAETEASASVAAAASQHDLTINGDNRATFNGMVAAEVDVKARGVGELKVRATANRSDTATFDYSTGRLNHAGSGNQHVDFTAKVEALAGASVTGTLREDGLQVAGSTRLIDGENTKLDLTLSGSKHGGDIAATARGDLNFSLTDGVEIGTSLETKVEAGTTTARMADAKVGLGVRYEFLPGAKLGVTVEKSLVNDAFSVHGPRTDDFKGAVADTVIQGGLQMTFDILGAGPLTVAGDSPSVAKSALHAATGMHAVGGGAGEIQLRNVQVTQARRALPLYPPTVLIRGAGTPVLIERCKIETPSPGGSSVALSIEESEVPVSVRDNTLIGGGIDLDGDTDAGPRQGLIPDACRIERNQISAPEALNGIRIDDLKDATLSGNTIEAVHAVIVSAARVSVINSVFPEFQTTTALIMARQGKNGPGVLLASGCEFSVPVTLLAGGYGQFSNNTFQNAELAIGFSGSGMAYAICEGNRFLNSSIGISPTPAARGYLKTAGNTFSGSDISDENFVTGGLVNDPVRSNGGLDPSSDVSSPVDFNGDGCPDFPDDCLDKETGECGCKPTKPVPLEPEWPRP